MSTTVPAGPLADVRDMYVVHRTFRREFRLIPELIRGVGNGDTARAATIAGHLDLVLAGLHLHHTGEDEVLWPLLLERAAPEAELIHTMQAQHEQVDAYAAKIEPLAADWRATGSAVRGEQLARLVEAFRVALLEHLDLEEREILPIASSHVTADEWNALGEHGSQEVDRSKLPILFGSLLEEATPEERAMMLDKQPFVVRLLLNTIGKRAYRRYITGVRGG